MPVDTKHPDYLMHEVQWERCRDAVAGEDAIKDKGRKYLPSLGGQTDVEYTAYRDRAMFYGASGRTRDGLLGAMFIKEPTIKLPSKLEYLRKAADPAGTPLVSLMKKAADDLLVTGRQLLLVEMPQTRQLPYLVLYPAEDVINWRCRIVDGAMIADQIILKECVSEPAPDGFGCEHVHQLRVLELTQEGYTQQIYRLGEHGYTAHDEKIIPTFRGKPLLRIPAVPLGPGGIAWSVGKPPLLDLVNVNLSHYRSSADLEHGRHFTALPTPWVSGLTAQSAKGQDWKIGSATAWVLPAGASVGMLEFNGAGLSYLESALEAKEALMVLLGARLLETQKRQAEAAEALRLRQGGDTATLSNLVDTISDAFTKALQYAAEWSGLPIDDVSAAMSKDFFDTKLDPTMLRELVSAWQGSAMPLKALIWNLRQGDMLPPDLDDEQIAELINVEVSAMRGEPMKLDLAAPPDPQHTQLGGPQP